MNVFLRVVSGRNARPIGGHNHLPIELHQLLGTFRPARHGKAPEKPAWRRCQRPIVVVRFAG